MTTAAKRKGDAAELEVARIIADLTGWNVRRKLGAGRADDTGDLHGIPDTTVQVKNYVDVARAIREGLNELEVQCANAGTTFAVLLVRRRGGKWAAVMPIEMFCTYARESLAVAA
jgi:hypothetical protein